jgi:kinesin family protein 5
LKLRKNNWDSDTYEFDEVLTEFASQKRVYEVVAKPVVEVPTNEFKSVIYVEDLYLGLLIQMSLTGPGGGLTVTEYHYYHNFLIRHFHK